MDYKMAASKVEMRVGEKVVMLVGEMVVMKVVSKAEPTA